jgi:hypothetical protein
MERMGESARGGFNQKTRGISGENATEIQSIKEGRDVICKPCHCQLQIAQHCARAGARSILAADDHPGEPTPKQFASSIRQTYIFPC